MSEPYTEKFQKSFSRTGLNAQEVRYMVECTLIALRRNAAEKWSEWFWKKGYFNGDMRNDVCHDGTDVRCVVTLTCYGLPVESKGGES